MKALLKDRFVLISRWHLDCGIEPAWRLISRVREWPAWWPQVRRVRVEDDAADDAAMADPRVGSRAAIEWRTPLGYGLRLRVTTTRVAAPFELEGIASGDLEGHGLWLLEPRHADGVLITYRWDVHLNRHWMRLTSPLLRPLFARNHAAVMRAGASAMAQAIGCKLLRFEDISVSPGTPAEALRAPHQPQPSA
jgi:hypothetical protein